MTDTLYATKNMPVMKGGCAGAFLVQEPVSDVSQLLQITRGETNVLMKPL